MKYSVITFFSLLILIPFYFLTDAFIALGRREDKQGKIFILSLYFMTLAVLVLILWYLIIPAIKMLMPGS